jgi:SAM-dependent methyltransferase
VTSSACPGSFSRPGFTGPERSVRRVLPATGSGETPLSPVRRGEIVGRVTTDELLQEALTQERYPRSSAYDPAWVVSEPMGPHPLWSVEALLQVMQLEPEMRVLDLGCGAALTSVFLAREYGVRVWAADLWVDPTDNWRRIQEAGAGDRVHPLKADARDLPFARGTFDAIVSIGSYHYFGTDASYVAACAEFLKPGGTIGVVMPGLRRDPGPELPAYLKERWGPDLCGWLDPAWWRRTWEKTGSVTVEVAEMVPDGWGDWLGWLEACDLVGKGYEPDAAMLRADAGELLGLVRLVGKKG